MLPDNWTKYISKKNSSPCQPFSFQNLMEYFSTGSVPRDVYDKKMKNQDYHIESETLAMKDLAEGKAKKQK